MAKRIIKVVPSFSNDGLLSIKELWCVCWFGDTEDHGWVQHKGPDVEKDEAERRLAWSRKTYPHIISWIEQA